MGVSSCTGHCSKSYTPSCSFGYAFAKALGVARAVVEGRPLYYPSHPPHAPPLGCERTRLRRDRPMAPLSFTSNNLPYLFYNQASSVYSYSRCQPPLDNSEGVVVCPSLEQSGVNEFGEEEK